MELNLEQQKMIEYIKLFLNRKQLVIQALLDIAPGILTSTGLIKREDVPRKPRTRKSDVGSWGENEEWEYFRHGLGCLLIHTVTKERIEWDASNESTFDRYWFSNWLYWYSRNDIQGKTEAIADLPKDAFRNYVFELITQLLKNGILIQEYLQNFNEHTLVNHSIVQHKL